MFRCRRCGEVFEQKPNEIIKALFLENIMPWAERATTHYCDDGTGATGVADFIGLIPIQKP